MVLSLLLKEEKNRILNLHENATKRQYLSEQPTKKDFINYMLNEQRGDGNNNLQESLLTPDAGTIVKNIDERGGPFDIGLKGNELLIKLKDGWESMTTSDAHGGSRCWLYTSSSSLAVRGSSYRAAHLGRSSK